MVPPQTGPFVEDQVSLHREVASNRHVALKIAVAGHTQLSGSDLVSSDVSGSNPFGNDKFEPLTVSRWDTFDKALPYLMVRRLETNTVKISHRTQPLPIGIAPTADANARNSQTTGSCKVPAEEWNVIAIV